MNDMKLRVMRAAFPQGIIGDGRPGEVNQLSTDAVIEFKNNPRVKIIEMRTRTSKFTNSQHNFIATVDDTYHIRGRICDAMAGSGYAMYAVIHDVDLINESYIVEQAQIIRDVFSD